MQLRDRVTSTVSVQAEETVDYEVTFSHLESIPSGFTKR
jgi:hypothetical protein